MGSEYLVDGVPCMMMRGGSSKGASFLADDLPADTAARDDLLLRIMGTPDPRQIDGMGGGTPLTSNVAIVRASPASDHDLDFLFLKLGIDRAFVTDAQNCGNILAGVGPFGVERGLVEGSGPRTSLRIRLLNSDSSVTARFPVENGLPTYAGDTMIASVPFPAAAIHLEFEDMAGGTCGALLPTGNPVDQLPIEPGGATVAATCIDNGMPVVVLAASDLGVTGYESPSELEANHDLRRRLEHLRLAAGPLMNLGDVESSSVPKLTLVAPPLEGGILSTRTFVPHHVHSAIGVFGALSVATAAVLDDGPTRRMARLDPDQQEFILEHPTGMFTATVDVDPDTGHVRRAGIVRTARKLMDGRVYPRG